MPWSPANDATRANLEPLAIPSAATGQQASEPGCRVTRLRHVHRVRANRPQQRLRHHWSSAAAARTDGHHQDGAPAAVLISREDLDSMEEALPRHGHCGSGSPRQSPAAAIAFITGPLADNPQRVGGLLRSWRVDGEIATAALGQVERQSAVGTSAHGPSRAAGTTATPSSERRYA